MHYKLQICKIKKRNQSMLWRLYHQISVSRKQDRCTSCLSTK